MSYQLLSRIEEEVDEYIIPDDGSIGHSSKEVYGDNLGDYANVNEEDEEEEEQDFDSSITQTRNPLVQHRNFILSLRAPLESSETVVSDNQLLSRSFHDAFGCLNEKCEECEECDQEDTDS